MEDKWFQEEVVCFRPGGWSWGVVAAGGGVVGGEFQRLWSKAESERWKIPLNLTTLGHRSPCILLTPGGIFCPDEGQRDLLMSLEIRPAWKS